MNTQARLTISSVLVMTAIVAIISALDLGYEMEAQFEGTLAHADLARRVVSKMVVETLNRDRQHPWRETLRDAHSLESGLTDILSASHALLEIAVCDSDNRVLVD